VIGMADEHEISARAQAWATTMRGHAQGDLVQAHSDSRATLGPGVVVGRQLREERERMLLRPGAALAQGAGSRIREEEPDDERTCFERDRDRIVHSTAFRRLAGKTQVVVYPSDHQRTRLTHALEVAQVACSVARAVGVNVTLTEAIALGHDCGHGPGGHASEDAFDRYIPGGFEHGPWGADVTLEDLNLCAETLNGIRNHSWSRVGPATVEGEIVSWADRIAYCAHDLEDAAHAGIVDLNDLPDEVTQIAGRTRREQLSTFIRAIIRAVDQNGVIGMPVAEAGALAALRAFNYERIYIRQESLAQSDAVVAVLTALVDHYLDDPSRLPSDTGDPADDPVYRAVGYVAGMTDRYAFATAVERLGWDADRLPPGIDRK
jgi:dGTPase